MKKIIKLHALSLHDLFEILLLEYCKYACLHM